MKASKINTIALLLTVLAFPLLSLGSTSPESEKEEIIAKARKLVKEANPNDWFVYAVAAEKCIRISANLEEAESWIERSLDIKETGYNLSIQGDLYLQKGDYKLAIESFERSLQIGSLQEEGFDPAKIQAKIMQVRRI